MSAASRGQNTFNLKILLVLSFGHLATDICQSALPAILPFLKAKLLLSYTMTGVILLASNITSSVIQPLFGYLSDQKEKAFLLPFGCVCAGLGLSFLSMPDHYELVLLLVIVSGLGIVSYHPEGFKTARFFTGDKMATGLAVFTVGGNIGLALGPITALFIITHFGLDYLPLMLLLSLIFLFSTILDKALPGPGPTRACLEGGLLNSEPERGVSLCRVTDCRGHHEIVDPFWSHGLYSSVLYRLFKGRPALRRHIGFGFSRRRCGGNFGRLAPG